jgi:outer membrane protein assembly factor BamD
MSAFLKPILLTASVTIVVAGCASSTADFMRNIVEGVSTPEEIYAAGSEALAEGRYGIAVGYYQALEARYPFANVTRQAQLDMVFAHYQARQPESAIDAAEEFEAENPTHPRVDYCIYMKGLVYFDQAPSFLERTFNSDLSVRPPQDTLLAYTTFQELLRRFPESAYAPDAQQRMIFMRNRLAAYENHVANYYIERGAYVAAINRAKFSLEHYPGAPAIQESLIILEEAYSLLGMPDLAADAQRVSEINFGFDLRPQPDTRVEVLELEVADAAQSPNTNDPES